MFILFLIYIYIYILCIFVKAWAQSKTYTSVSVLPSWHQQREEAGHAAFCTWHRHNVNNINISRSLHRDLQTYSGSFCANTASCVCVCVNNNWLCFCYRWANVLRNVPMLFTLSPCAVIREHLTWFLCDFAPLSCRRLILFYLAKIFTWITVDVYRRDAIFYPVDNYSCLVLSYRIAVRRICGMLARILS